MARLRIKLGGYFLILRLINSFKNNTQNSLIKYLSKLKNKNSLSNKLIKSFLTSPITNFNNYKIPVKKNI